MCRVVARAAGFCASDIARELLEAQTLSGVEAKNVWPVRVCYHAKRSRCIVRSSVNMNTAISKWNDTDGELTLEAVKSLHTPSYKYRITFNKHSTSPKLGETSRKGLVYVLKGRISYHFEDEIIHLKAGDICTIPEGSHQYEIGEEGVEHVRVWELPEFVWKSQPGYDRET